MATPGRDSGTYSHILLVFYDNLSILTLSPVTTSLQVPIHLPQIHLLKTPTLYRPRVTLALPFQIILSLPATFLQGPLFSHTSNSLGTFPLDVERLLYSSFLKQLSAFSPCPSLFLSQTSRNTVYQATQRHHTLRSREGKRIQGTEHSPTKKSSDINT